jgi:hypothetical protein
VFWAAGHETREDIVGLYQRVQEHSDATISALPIDAPGYVPRWREEVKLFNIMAHVLSDMPLGMPGTPTSCGSSSTAPPGRTRRARP